MDLAGASWSISLESFIPRETCIFHQRKPSNLALVTGHLVSLDEAVADELLLQVRLAERRHRPPARAARPAVLIVQPSVETDGVRLLDTGANGGHPLLAHVGGLKPDAGMHEGAAEAGLLHGPDLALDLLRVQPVVPCPEGDATEPWSLQTSVHEPPREVAHRRPTPQRAVAY